MMLDARGGKRRGEVRVTKQYTEKLSKETTGKTVGGCRYPLERPDMGDKPCCSAGQGIRAIRIINARK